MKTKTTKNAVSLRILKGLTGLLLVLFLTGSLHAQIPVQGLAVDHEGVAAWDADGSGPEPAAYGHTHPFGWGSSLYYSASRDYKDIDPDPDAAMCHFLDNITGFPLFLQALADNAFLPGQVKVKQGLLDEKNDIEGEDWFTFNNMHYQNRYDGYYHIELNGELMISGYINYFNYCISSTGTFFLVKSSFTLPFDASENSSLEVQEVAGAFLDDMDGEELRFVGDTCPPAGESFGGNGRINGAYFDIVSGYLEKGLPELPYVGLAAYHQGLAGWDADGTGPEPEAYGHTFNYGGYTWWMAYYTASRDYDDIDPDPNAALGHATDNATGFTNLEIQMDYRGFTMDQLKVKTGISTLGNDEEGVDWGVDGSIHWYHHFGTPVTIEIAGEPILEYLIDTNYSYNDMDYLDEDWWSYSTCSPVTDISANASADAQYVAISLLKDIGGQSIKSYMEGHYTGDFSGNGRYGAFHQIDVGFFTLGEAFGTSVAAGNVSGLWEADKSPYMIEGDLIVPDGETLTIEPGVTVAFRGPWRILVNGCVNAEGTAEENIIFTHSNPTVLWDGLDYDNTPATNDSSIFNYCTFEYGYAQRPWPFNSGGAFAVRNFDKLKFTNCIFQHNLADQPGTYDPSGGAIALWNSDPLIQNCIFRYNYAEDAAGAILVYEQSNPIISGCLFYENETAFWAGAIGFYQSGGGILLNNTIAGNHAVIGGGLAFWDNSSPEIINTILWDNVATEQGNQVNISQSNCMPGFYYNDIEEGKPGFGGEPFMGDYLFNLDEAPMFMEDPPYMISDGSPCIDMGTPDSSEWYYPQYLPAYCLCGNPRISGQAIDLGCYERLSIGITDYANHEDFSFRVFPNPVNSKPTIEFYLTNNAHVNISILDIHGKVVSEILTKELQSGKNQLTWNAENVSPGIYFCRLQVGDNVEIAKIVVMR